MIKYFEKMAASFLQNKISELEARLKAENESSANDPMSRNLDMESPVHKRPLPFDISSLHMNSGSPSHDRSRSPGTLDQDGRLIHYRDRNSSLGPAPPIPPRRRLQSPASFSSSSPRECYNGTNLPQRNSLSTSQTAASSIPAKTHQTQYHQRSFSVERSSFGDGLSYLNHHQSRNPYNHNRQINSGIPIPSPRGRSSNNELSPQMQQQQQQQHPQKTVNSVVNLNSSESSSQSRPNIPPRSRSLDKSGYAFAITSPSEAYNFHDSPKQQQQMNKSQTSGMEFENNFTPNNGDHASNKISTGSRKVVTRKKSDLDKPRVEMPPDSSYDPQAANKVVRSQSRGSSGGRNSPRYNALSKSQSNTVVPNYNNSSNNKGSHHKTGHNESFDMTWPPPSSSSSNKIDGYSSQKRQTLPGSLSNSPTVRDPMGIRTSQSVRDRLSGSSPNTTDFSPKRSSGIPRPQLQNSPRGSAGSSPRNSTANSQQDLSKSASFENQFNKSNINTSTNATENVAMCKGNFNEKGIRDTRLALYYNSSSSEQSSESSANSSSHEKVQKQTRLPSGTDIVRNPSVTQSSQNHLSTGSKNTSIISNSVGKYNSPILSNNESINGPETGSSKTSLTSPPHRPSNIAMPSNAKNIRPQTMGIPAINPRNISPNAQSNSNPSFNLHHNVSPMKANLAETITHPATRPTLNLSAQQGQPCSNRQLDLENKSAQQEKRKAATRPTLQFGGTQQTVSNVSKPTLNFGAQESKLQPKSITRPTLNFAAQESMQQPQTVTRPTLNFGAQETNPSPQTVNRPTLNFGAQESNPPPQTATRPTLNFGSQETRQPASRPTLNFNSQQHDTATNKQPANRPKLNFGEQQKLHFNQSSMNSELMNIANNNGTTLSNGPSDGTPLPLQSQYTLRDSKGMQPFVMEGSVTQYNQPQSIPQGYYNTTTPPPVLAQYYGSNGNFNEGVGSSITSPPNYDRQSPRSYHSSSPGGSSSTPSNRSTPTPTRPTLSFGGHNKLNLSNRNIPMSVSSCDMSFESPDSPGSLSLPGRPTFVGSPGSPFSNPGIMRKKKDFHLPMSPGQTRTPDATEIEMKYQEIMKKSGILNFGGKLIPTSIHELQHVCDLGHGTCGHVVKMKHAHTGHVMAVKQMRRSGNRDENKRIIMDLDVVIKSHNCPFIVMCIGSFITSTDVWICMELMSTCLEKLLKKYKAPIPEIILGMVAVATVKALHYLKEEHGVIHRDIKPSNILLNEKGEIKLCDFGISGRLVDSKAKTRSAGCAAYMAPERIDPPDPSRPDYDIRADVWSLGISLVELATGSFPYKDCKTDFEVLTRVLQEDPPVLPPGKGFTLDFCSFVCHCLTKDYKKRPKYRELLKHPFIKKFCSANVDVAGWYAEVLQMIGPPTPSPITPCF